jgi:hypothetical protein
VGHSDGVVEAGRLSASATIRSPIGIESLIRGGAVTPSGNRAPYFWFAPTLRRGVRLRSSERAVIAHEQGRSDFTVLL